MKITHINDKRLSNVYLLLVRDVFGECQYYYQYEKSSKVLNTLVKFLRVITNKNILKRCRYYE